jgi:hypothetical protein
MEKKSPVQDPSNSGLNQKYQIRMMESQGVADLELSCRALGRKSASGALITLITDSAEAMLQA